MNKFQTAGKVQAIKGSILTPHNAGLRFILSINNMAGKAEGNPLLPVFDKKWPKVRQESRGLFATKTGAYKMGSVSNMSVQSDTWIIGLLCQNEELQVDAASLEKCLKETAKLAKYEKASIHISSLLTDMIPELSTLASKCFVEEGISVSYYEELQAK
jgi:hypothetical protein